MSDSATPGTAAYQAPPSMGFSRQEYWSGVSCKIPRTVKLIETGNRMVFAGGWEEGGTRNYCLIETEFQFCKMKSIPEMGSGNGCTTVGIYFIPLKYTLKIRR